MFVQHTWSTCFVTIIEVSFRACNWMNLLSSVWSPCSIWHKSREVMKRNDKYVFTTRTIQRVHRLSVVKRLCSYRHSSQESTVVKFITNDSWNRGSEYFAGGTGDHYKEEVAFGNFNPHSNAPKRPQHSILNTEWHVQK